MKSGFRDLLLVGGFWLTMQGSFLSWAQGQPIRVKLTIEGKDYQIGAHIGVKVTVKSDSAEDLLVSGGFPDRDYTMDIRLTDPTGRLMMAKRPKSPPEIPDAPPLPFVFHGDRFIRIAPCEKLKAGITIMKENGLEKLYDIRDPGPYSVWVELPVMIFKLGTCDVNDPAWFGVLQSEPVFFNIRKVAERLSSKLPVIPIRP
jgi:hypothetical protein